MADRQLRLFAHAKPLLERIGPEFFRATPRRPGVYLITGARGEVLYVGQSGNLRVRLNCYKNGNPDALPRRIVRLIHSVASITWEECASKQLARVRENELLRLHKPKFNRVNTYPQAYGFIGMAAHGEELTLARLSDVSTSQMSEFGVRNADSDMLRESGARAAQVRVYGAFKRGAVYGFGSVLRLLWSAVYRPPSPFDLPRQLLNAKPPQRFTVNVGRCPELGGSTRIAQGIHDYLSGESDAMIEWVTARVRTQGLSLFHQNFIEGDLEALRLFFETGPRRIWRLKREHGLEEPLVGKEELDDLLALSLDGRSIAREAVSPEA